MAIPFKKVAAGVIGVVVLGVGAYAWLHLGIESTDDAFIESDVITIAPRVGGTVKRVMVSDNQSVAIDDLLFEIDPTDYQLKVDEIAASLDASQSRRDVAKEDKGLIEAHTSAVIAQAEAALGAAKEDAKRSRAESKALEADAVLAERNVLRFKSLLDKDEISSQRFDQAVAERDAVSARLQASRESVAKSDAAVREAEGKLQEAKTAPRQIAVKSAQLQSVLADTHTLEVNLAEAKQALSYTEVKAPAAGRVSKKAVLPGQVVQANQAVLAIVSGAPWVVANFKETQLSTMKVGQKVDIHVDALPSETFKGHVDSLQAGTGSRFSLLPPENATGNYVKVVQRLPVKIVFDEPMERLTQLAPGMSVVPTVHVNDKD